MTAGLTSPGSDSKAQRLPSPLGLALPSVVPSALASLSFVPEEMGELSVGGDGAVCAHGDTQGP